jgi:hypothetical protein
LTGPEADPRGRKMKGLTKTIPAMVIMTLLVLPQVLEATCLRGCESSPASVENSSVSQQGGERRTNSHNFGDNSTAILGDVRIQIGHKKIEIKGMENSNNSVIDASINSTIILGNVKQ